VRLLIAGDNGGGGYKLSRQRLKFTVKVDLYNRNCQTQRGYVK